MAKDKSIDLTKRIDRLNECVLINFQRGFWTASAKFDKSKLGSKVPKEIIRATQDLLDDKTLIDDILTVQNKAKYFVKNNSLPFPIDSVFRIPQDKIIYVEDELTNYFMPMHQERVEILANAIDKLEKRFKKKYPNEYRPELYPTKKEIRQRFYIRYTPFYFGVPEKGLEVFNSKAYQRQVSKIKGMLDEMEEMTVAVIGNDLLKRIDNLHSKCQDDGDSLHGKSVGSITRFIDKWDDLWRGEVDDKKLTMIVGRLRREMKKVSTDRLKNNDDFRNEISGKLETIMEKLERIPNVELKRKIDL
jgi:hypothetical protein